MIATCTVNQNVTRAELLANDICRRLHTVSLCYITCNGNGTTTCLLNRSSHFLTLRYGAVQNGDLCTMSGKLFSHGTA
ncbi:hypothetical protein D3C74_478900 [compost metagenome]